MNLFDIIFIAIILVFFFMSFLKGILRDSFTTMGLLIGYFAAGRYHQELVGYIEPYVHNPAASKVATYLIIILSGWFLGLLFSIIIAMFYPASRPTLSGRVLGGLLGIFKGALVCMVIFFVIRGYVPAFADELETSIIAPWLQKTWLVLHDIGLA